MKKFLIVLLIPLIFACGESEETKRLRAQRDSLLAQSDMKDDAINEFVDALNEIENNLAEIREKESIIRNTTQDEMLEQDAKDRINDDILSIYELMLENKQSLAKMKKRMRNANVKNKKLTQMIANYTTQMEQKDKEITQLRDELNRLNILVDDLNTNIDSLSANVDSLADENEYKDKVIDDKTTELNTAYYVLGSKSELMDHNVLTKEGGFIGIGKNTKLEDNLNLDYFTKVDIRELTSVPIHSKKIEIITTHPKGSYNLVGEKPVEKLEITDSQKFWSLSKFLVIVTK